MECPLEFLFPFFKCEKCAWFILLIFDTGCCNPGLADSDLNRTTGRGSGRRVLNSFEPDTDFPVLNFSNQTFILEIIYAMIFYVRYFTTYNNTTHYPMATKRRGRQRIWIRNSDLRIWIRNSDLRIGIRKKFLWFQSTGIFLYPNALLAWMMFFFVKKISQNGEKSFFSETKRENKYYYKVEIII